MPLPRREQRKNRWIEHLEELLTDRTLNTLLKADEALEDVPLNYNLLN